MRKKMFKGTNIYVEDDLTEQERNVQNVIWDEAKRIAGSERVAVRYKKARIGNKWFEWDEEDKKLIEKN